MSKHVPCTRTTTGQTAQIAVTGVRHARKHGWVPDSELGDRSEDSGTNNDQPDTESGVTEESHNG